MDTASAINRDILSRMGEIEYADVIREHLNKLGEDEQRRIETIRIIREWVREKPNFVDVRLGL